MYRAQDSGRHSPSVNSHSAQLQQHHHTSQQPSSNWQYVQGPNGSYYAVISPAHDAGRQTQQQPQRSSVYTSHSTSGHPSNSRAGGSPAAPYKPPPGRIDSRMMVSSAASASVSYLSSSFPLPVPRCCSLFMASISKWIEMLCSADCHARAYAREL
jgi:hypothetical protein